MMNHRLKARIDDYLDLYLFAASMNDVEWQQEIKGRLASLLRVSADRERQKAKNLRTQLDYINRRMIDLYLKMNGRNARPADAMTHELYALKQRRLELEAELGYMMRRTN